MLKLSDLAAWIEGVVPAGTSVFINRVPDSPDQVVMASIAHGGKGFLSDGAFQEVVVHTRSRALTDAGAEQLALTVDAALMNTNPLQIGASYVRDAYPAGGPPVYFERDQQNRTVYFCDYVLEVQR
jgi:hypothetical protein